ncbi:MAG: phosphate/phosphite/phosphonate ABC transporter substrate-binding protein [Helicobacteraceae bacterium]|jgi:ABC-type phosphate/phosphonate transport system substrate-binding protein|nr:phosphate/phosphite/phosphonate ABC transporter substrate-binding protein [Helicobacteraceae bacterium]
MIKIILGAVSYDPKVVPIWDIAREHFTARGVGLEYALFSSYEFQVEAALNGFIDIAWNTNVAYLQTLNASGGAAKAIAMRDTDVGFTSKLIARANAKFAQLDDLNGKTIAFGSADSAQAKILPFYYLEEAGVRFSPLLFDSDLGKHGDTGRSEYEALEAVRSGRADAAAVGGSTWVRMQESGVFAEGEIVSFWTSEGYCHCNFTALPSVENEKLQAFEETLFAMDANDAQIKKMMTMEGLNRWIKTGEAELEGYKSLAIAMKRYDLYKTFRLRSS